MNRTADSVIVDEVDSMLLDKGENVLYLSHAIPELKYLWPLFIEIWQAVHAPDVALGRSQDIYTVVRFIKQRIRGGAGGEDGSGLYFPNSMSSFINARLTAWVQNAFLAKSIKEKDSYIVANYEKKGHRVVIMDKDTGVEQMSMNWSNGLHQFIQLKHSDKLSSESLKAVFMSNICYFRGFQGRLFGITGTLGSTVEMELLSQCYALEFFQIPRFKARRCYEEESILSASKSEWLEKITTVVQENVKNARAVLIITENVEMVETIGNRLKSNYNPSKVYAYQSSFDQEFKRRRAAGPLTSGDVIVATNIAGRGTDLKTDKGLEAAGGLHVILSYVPSNVRIEEQAFGRTARAGLSGTVQYIVYAEDSTNLSVDTLRTQRDEREGQRLHNFRLKSIPRIEIEEKLCQKFNSLLQRVKENLKSIDKSLVDLHVENLKNKWALWLDSMGEKIRLVHVTKEGPIFQEFDKFQEQMIQKSQNASDSTREIFENGPIEITKLGKYYEDEEVDDVPKALEYFNRAIEMEPYYSEIAHYYKAACIIKQTDSGVHSKREATKHLKIADKLIRKRMNLLFASSQTLGLTDDMRRMAGEGSMANRYESQVKNESELLQVHCGKIGDAIGVAMNGQFFSGVKGVLDEAEGDGIYKVLLRHTSILKKLRLSKKIYIDPATKNIRVPRAELQGRWDEVKWPNTFKYCQDEVCARIQTKLQSNQRHLEEDDLAEFILTQEKLWTAMKVANFIQEQPTENVEVVAFKDTKVKEDFASLKFPKDLVDHQSVIGKVLAEADSRVFEDSILDDFDLTKEQMNKVNELLRSINAIKKTTLHSAKVIPKLAFNNSNGRWNGIPDSLKKYTDVIEGIIEEISSEGAGSPVSKEIISLEDIPLPETAEQGSKQLFAFFSDSGLIKEPKVRFNLKSADSKDKINSRFDEIEAALKACEPLKSKLKKEGPTVDDIMESLRNAVGKIKTIPCIEISYEQLSDYFKTGNYPPEIEEFRDNMFFHLLECTEKKSWWDWGAFIVAMLGIAQIIAGVLLEVFTAGAATHLAMALISEGVGDIAYAIEAGINKNFSWKEYGIQKAISIAISIVTAGVGAWMSRGAQVARFAGKTGFQLFKAVGKRILKKAISAVAFALSDIGVQKLLDYIRQEILNGAKNTLSGEVDKQGGMFAQLLTTMDLVYDHSYEKGQAEKVIQDTFATVLENNKNGNVRTEIHKYSSKVASGVASGMGNAGSKLFKHGSEQLKNMNLGGTNVISHSAKVAKMAKHVSKVIQTVEITKALCQMAGFTPEILQQMILKLKLRAVDLKKAGGKNENKRIEKNSSESFKTFKTGYVVTIKTEIVDYIMSQVQSALIQPQFNELVHSTLKKAGKSMSSGTKSILQSMGKDKNVQILADFRRSQTLNAIKDNFDVLVHANELDPDTPVKTKDGSEMTLSDATRMFGDSVQLYQDKKGKVYFERPSFEQYVKTFGDGKTAGAFELMICAKYMKANILVEDTTGELQQSASDTPTVIKGGKKNDPPIQVVYMKNPDGSSYFAPKINGEIIDLPSNMDGTTSLYQTLNLLQKMKNQSGSIPDEYLTDFPTDFVSQVRQHALKSSTMRSLYSQKAYELGAKFEIGVPMSKLPEASTTKDIREMKFSDNANKLTRTTSLNIPRVRKSEEDTETNNDSADIANKRRNLRRAGTAPAKFRMTDIPEEFARDSKNNVKVFNTVDKSKYMTNKGSLARDDGFNLTSSSNSTELLVHEFKVHNDLSVMTREEFMVWINKEAVPY